MIPYAVVEYYGPITGNFDGTGKGLDSGLWEKIYLCNGNHGTPDKRGVVGVGATDGTMLGNTMSSVVNPSYGNPTYSANPTIIGTNGVVLNLTQIPSHTHVANVTVTEVAHKHLFPNTLTGKGTGGVGDFASSSSNISYSDNTETNAAKTNLTVEVINAPMGSGLSHSNFQPGLGCYYIQYRP